MAKPVIADSGQDRLHELPTGAVVAPRGLGVGARLVQTAQGGRAAPRPGAVPNERTSAFIQDCGPRALMRSLLPGGLASVSQIDEPGLEQPF